MDELEYLFKHALAQEAAYESILPQKRKELHLMVADSIQSAFRERLHELYGTLAYHYSCGQDEEKAEEYLIKAGEEALKSSASSEAFHCYQEALRLYLKKHGDTADREKLAMFEKNIAFAFYNRGHFAEAAKHFDDALTYYGEKSPKHPIMVALKLFVSLAEMLISLYLPSLKFRKTPSDRSRELVMLSVKKVESLSQIAPKRFFLETLFLLRRMSKYDLTKLERGAGSFSGTSMLFAYSGLSFRISRKILESFEDKIDKKDAKSVLVYDTCVLVHNLLAGNWGAIKEYDDDLVNQNMGMGEFFTIAHYAEFHKWINIERGRLADARKAALKLSEIADVVEYDYARGAYIRHNLLLLMKYGMLHRAPSEIEDGIEICKKIGQQVYNFWLYNYAARMKFMLKDIVGAEDALKHAREALGGWAAAPLWKAANLVTEFLFCLYRLEESMKTGNQRQIRENREITFLSGRKAVKISRKSAGARTEALRLMGTYSWHIGRHKKALKWWRKSIEIGDRIGARVDLSRTYFEVGKRLFEEKSKYRELDGIGAEEYLNKARSMFEEMDLQWDMDELEKITGSIP